MELEGSPSEFRDWAHLPLAAVKLVSEKIKSITDYVRFRAVCSPWRSASLPKPRHHLPAQLPWLMIPGSPNQDWSNYPVKKDDGVRLFYDLWESKMRKLHLPELSGMKCCASHRGWLLLVATGGTEAFLLNPITRDRVQLPPFTTPLKHLWVRDDLADLGIADVPDYDASHCFQPLVGDFAITRVTFSGELTDPNCLISVFLPRCWGIFRCRVGDPCWSLVTIRHDSSDFADMACYNGRYYMLYKGAMAIIDPNKLEERGVCILEELREDSMFLVQQESGIYVVTVNNIEEEEGGRKKRKQKFELYQFQEQPWKLNKITDESNTTIFFGSKYHGLGVRSDDWDSLDAGSIYMEHKLSPPSVEEAHVLGSGSLYSIFFAKLVDGKFEPLVLDIAKEPPVWPHPPALWFQPSFL
ncbi:F-box family protein [Rhynchospora pubera]|uniref:F-box family protein n=1 Tax=Rhynchospora pubera TaxID=906938 RepID=A0AAV8GL90_9POAL|nr:F-box family protein [Rhynchospora pubera]